MNKIKVLLVEDETSLAMILSDTLEAQGNTKIRDFFLISRFLRIKHHEAL